MGILVYSLLWGNAGSTSSTVLLATIPYISESLNRVRLSWSSWRWTSPQWLASVCCAFLCLGPTWTLKNLTFRVPYSELFVSVLRRGRLLGVLRQGLEGC